MSNESNNPSKNRLTWLWVAFAIILLASFAIAASSYNDRKLVTLEMSWKRGDANYGPNVVQLESDCVGIPTSGCFCSMNFLQTTSIEFADYIASFEKNKIPVKFYVYYNKQHVAEKFRLVTVGNWPEDKFGDNEKSISSGYRWTVAEDKTVHTSTVAACFPKSK